MATNPDFRDLFSELSVEQAEFIVVGAHAVMSYTEPRFTKDLDIWIRPTAANAERVYRALERFGAPMSQLSVQDLAQSGTIFQIGIAPNRIDILTSIDDVSFDDAWPSSEPSSYGDVAIRVLGLDDLLRNKRAAGRAQDMLDVQKLERRKAHKR